MRPAAPFSQNSKILRFLSRLGQAQLWQSNPVTWLIFTIFSLSILGSVPGQQLDARAWRKFSWSKGHCVSAVPGLRGTKLSYAGSMSSRQAHHTAFRREVRRDSLLGSSPEGTD
jgi:hypothetical protein